MFFYQFVHSSESILGVRENFHSIHPSGVYTFFQKLVMISEFFQRKVGSHLFSKACWFFSLTTYFFFFLLLFFLSLSFVYFFFLFVFFLFFLFFHEVFCYLNMCIFLWGIFAIYMHIQGILLPKHTYIYFVKCFFVYIHAYLRYFHYLNIHIYILWGMTTFRACACFI